MTTTTADKGEQECREAFEAEVAGKLHLGRSLPSGEYRTEVTRLIYAGWCACWNRRATTAQATPAIPPGYAVVPLIPTRAMEEVVNQDEWQWEDLLAAAEAITEDQYNEIASAPDIQPQAASAPVAEKWQPIETAPKDGTTILALQCWIYHTDARRQPHYVLHEVFFNDDGDWEIVEDGEILDDDSLTHWLPRNRIPATPADSKEGD